MKILICSSSRDTINNIYLELADKVYKYISDLGYDLIFGAASTGMMKYNKHFNNISSYTTKKYEDDLKNINSKNEYLLDTSFDRTKNMYLDCDLILILPGGSGTLAEIFSYIEENRSIDNPKKLIIFNYNNYYNDILNIIDKLVINGFNDNSIYNYFSVINSFDELKKEVEI